MATLTNQPNQPFANPKAIAQAGEGIYERLRSALEASDPGKFVAINIKNGNYFVNETPDTCLERAREKDPEGLFHLIRIGFPGAFNASYAFPKTDCDWLFG